MLGCGMMGGRRGEVPVTNSLRGEVMSGASIVGLRARVTKSALQAVFLSLRMVFFFFFFFFACRDRGVSLRWQGKKDTENRKNQRKL